MVKFETQYGIIYIDLPDDMARGDIISGKLMAKPKKDKKKKKQAKNMAILNKHVMEINNQKTPVKSGWGKWTIPDVEKLTITLLDHKGKTAAKIHLPLPVPDEAPVFINDDFRCADYAQTGGPIRIHGIFDGDFSDTDVRIGEKKLEKWAESPRQIILESPRDVIGMAHVYFKEGEYNGEFKYRNISVVPGVGKTDLVKGEKTNLTVIVRGLENLDRDIPLRIENRTPDIVKMEGESGTVILIHPSDVQAGGTYTHKRVLTGKTRGTFRIRAGIVLPPLELQAGYKKKENSN
jgi:hypothetical protein